jgi:uncharacterized OB-fold protein
MIKGIKTPIRLDYEANAGRDMARFLAAIAEGRFVGRRCPSCRRVYLPPRGACPTCAVVMAEDVPVADTGTLTTFCIVNVPYEGQVMKLPYVYGHVLLDGADITFAHLIKTDDVRMGMRVRAEWGELGPTMEAIRGFVPTGEPDASFDWYKEHL